MSSKSETTPSLSLQLDPYEEQVDKIEYTKIEMLPYTSNRGMKLTMLRNNLWNAVGQAKFGFVYGGSIGAVSGVILSSYTAYKTRSPAILVVSALVSGGFFGSLVAISSIIGGLA